MHHASPIANCIAKPNPHPGAHPRHNIRPNPSQNQPKRPDAIPTAANRLLPVLLRLIPVLLLLSILPLSASAEGPRWVTGPPYFTVSATSVVWYTNNPAYSTDPADLSSWVPHAAADALVAAAAQTWNIPTSALTLIQNGQLAEHVSSANVYLGPSGLVFPADVAATNYVAIQIAVLYDTDGSLTDLLLGQGASDPAECLQSGVTESVDSINRNGTIQHALILLNGRCTGPDPNQQLQLQYQLMRVFGRVLGLGWSQANDNVFTGYPAPTNFQALNWPIMHPIDILCGNFSYQCLPSPFTLRSDDIASISSLYPIASGSVPPGKTPSLIRADQISGIAYFPSGQGMQGLNLTVRRHVFATAYIDPGDIVSTVSGMLFNWSQPNVVSGPVPASASTSTQIAASMGHYDPGFEGRFFFSYIPITPGQVLDDAIVTAEPINPLYRGSHAVGPYQNGPVAPSGTYGFRDNGVEPFDSNFYFLPVTNAASNLCPASSQGTPSSPVPVPASGFWSGALCTYGNAAFPTLTVAANHSFTLEVTALDDRANATTTKLQPLIGIWNLSDPTNALPTIAATPSPFNTIALGMTSLTASTSTASTLRLAIADDRGDGRPDYTYRARLLYAATVSPTSLPSSGGPITLTGIGFRPGCQLTINGVSAPVLTSTANTLIALAPAFATLNAGATSALDLTLTDPTTGGTTTLAAGLSYPASATPTTAESIAALTPQIYIPANLAVTVAEDAFASAANAALPSLPVAWSAALPPPGTTPPPPPIPPNNSQITSQITFSNAAATLPYTAALSTLTTSQGLAQVTATIAPLPAATSAFGQACINPTLCSPFTATAVDPSQWTPVPLLNAVQSVPSTGVLLPVLAQITDLVGHPIVGAPAIAYQTVTAYEPPCPPTGACPIPATLAATQTPLISDANGLVLIQPLQIGDAPQTLHLALSTGTQSLLALTLQKNP